ncbi:MAG: hypothetical protein ABIS36_05800 [Chryseolinea sp.]
MPMIFGNFFSKLRFTTKIKQNILNPTGFGYSKMESCTRSDILNTMFDFAVLKMIMPTG